MDGSPTNRKGFRRISAKGSPNPRQVSTFEEWVGDRDLAAPSTNYGARILPFQSWYRFKEAFSPELVAMAVHGSERPVRRLCDPFGGSGTSVLTAQFLGLDSVTIEVNPFLADLIRAKTAQYRVSELIAAVPRVARRASRARAGKPCIPTSLPPTFVEPGLKGRWLFDRAVAHELFVLAATIERESDPTVRRLFRILLGGLLVEYSNAVISGKGRRYRKGWKERRADPSTLLGRFCQCASNAIVEIQASRGRPNGTAKIISGDCLEKIDEIGRVDLIVCSPPYPNSFDYTDVYNVELWMLGYLSSAEENRTLRSATLSSHVQVKRQFLEAPQTPTMLKTMRKLETVRSKLWNRNLVDMVGGYFGDLSVLLEGCARQLRTRGQAWFVVGDSQYGGVHIKVADILAEIGERCGMTVVQRKPFRSMRLSPQQGGSQRLAESLVVFSKR